MCCICKPMSMLCRHSWRPSCCGPRVHGEGQRSLHDNFGTDLKCQTSLHNEVLAWGGSTHPLRAIFRLDDYADARNIVLLNSKDGSRYLKVAHKSRVQDSIVLQNSCADVCVWRLQASVHAPYSPWNTLPCLTSDAHEARRPPL